MTSEESSGVEADELQLEADLPNLIDEARLAVLFSSEDYERVGFDLDTWINITAPSFTIDEAARSLVSEFGDEAGLVQLNFDPNPVVNEKVGTSILVRIVEMRTAFTSGKDKERVAHVRMFAARDDLAVREYIIWAITSYTQEGRPSPFSVFAWQRMSIDQE
jgi:hypothetical protein